MSIKSSSDTIGNRTRDLPSCSAMPQPTAPPPMIILWLLIWAMSVFEIVVTGLRTGLLNTGLLFQFPGGKILFYLPSSNPPDQIWGTPSPLCNDYRGFFPRNWSGQDREPVKWPPFSTVAENGRSHTFTTQYGVHRVKLTFAFVQYFAHEWQQLGIIGINSEKRHCTAFQFLVPQHLVFIHCHLGRLAPMF